MSRAKLRVPGAVGGDGPISDTPSAVSLGSELWGHHRTTTCSAPPGLRQQLTPQGLHHAVDVANLSANLFDP
jgi:hypothetical protein